MEFPIYDVSNFSWDNYRIKEHNVLYENPYFGIIPTNRKKFAKRINKFKFVDPNGSIFKVVNFKVHPQEGLWKFFNLTRKIEFEFVKTEEQFTLEEFKKILLSRAKETQNEKLEELASKAKSFREILCHIVER